MAGTSTPALAAAVTSAGGLGSIAIGATDAQGAREMIESTRRLTNHYNVNVFVHRSGRADKQAEGKWLDALRPTFSSYGVEPPGQLREIYKSFNDSPDVLQVLIDTKPPIISFHFGLPPRDVLDRLRPAVLMASATNLAEARAIQDAGIDFVVAQGNEAGGHRGCFDPATDEELSTLALVRLLVKNIDIPVIAAGGIMDGAGIRAALELGAVAVQMGTAFVLCPESAADEGYRSAMRRAAGISSTSVHPHPPLSGPSTRITSLISGRPARCLRNKFTELAVGVQPDYPMAYDAGKALHAAAKAKGEHGYGAHWAGQGVGMAREMGAAELVETLVREYEEGGVGV